MGCDSTFSGSFTPSKPIPHDIVKRINESDCDLRVAGEHDDCGEPGDIVPWGTTMHGYNFKEDLFKIQRLLDPLGIKLNGSVEIECLDEDGFGMVEAVNGRVYERYGRVTYGKRVPVTLADVTSYAVKVLTKSKKGWRIFGWLAPKPLLDDVYDIVKPVMHDGRPCNDVPDRGLIMTARGREDAQEAVDTMRRRNKAKRFVIVKVEDRL